MSVRFCEIIHDFEKYARVSSKLSFKIPRFVISVRHISETKKFSSVNYMACYCVKCKDFVVHKNYGG